MEIPEQQSQVHIQCDRLILPLYPMRQSRGKSGCSLINIICVNMLPLMMAVVAQIPGNSCMQCK